MLPTQSLSRAALFLTATASLANAQQDVQGCDQSPSPAEVAAFNEMLSGNDAPGAPEALSIPIDYWVPVRWHIVRTSAGTGGFDPVHIPAYMADLDAAFSTGETWGDFGHLKFFEAAPVDFIDVDSLRMIETMAELEQLKAINPTVNAVDIWVIESFPGALGMSGVINLAGFSSFTVSQAAGIAPGIVVARTQMFPANINYKKLVLPHEMGHYFDLFHVFETAFGPGCNPNGCGGGDLVCDTPATPVLGGWNVSFTTCQYTGGGPNFCFGPWPTRNYMNVLNLYPCMDTFSSGQNGKAIQTLLFTRNDKNPLFTPNPPLPPTGQLPILTAYPGGDCNGNSVPDGAEILGGSVADCNQNWIPDSCEITLGWEADYDGDGVLDSCEVYCQTDLGYQGPGNVSLSLCGLELTQAPSVADLHLSGAVPNDYVWFVLSLTSTPTQFSLGILAPGIPFLELVAVLADGNGEFHFPLTGASGPPVPFYIQAIVPNMGVLQLSNALEVVIGT